MRCSGAGLNTVMDLRLSNLVLKALARHRRRLDEFGLVVMACICLMELWLSLSVSTVSLVSGFGLANGAWTGGKLTLSGLWIIATDRVKGAACLT